MITHLFKNFINDVQDYRASEKYWESLWLQTDYSTRARYGWTYPWVSTGSVECLDGNPIFSAWSRTLLRGVRVIQHEPTTQGLEIQAWPNFVGGSYYDPTAIQELVISCALTEAAANWAMSLLRYWIAGQSISFARDKSGQVATQSVSPDWRVAKYLYNPAA